MNNQVLQYLAWENIPRRFIEFKQKGEINYETPLFKNLGDAFNAFSVGKNIILLGGVGRGKSFLAYELAYQIKEEALNQRDNINCPIPCYRASQIVSAWKANFSNFEIIDKILTWHNYFNSNLKLEVKSLIVDEIDDIKVDDYVLLDELIISCYEKLIPLIFISNKDPKSFFGNFSDKAISRLNENYMLIRAEGDDLRKKM